MQISTISDALDNLNKKLGGADIEIEPSTNKVDALKKIYKTLGGADDVSGLSTVFQVLEKITEVAEAGGGGGKGGYSLAFAKVEATMPEGVEWESIAAGFTSTAGDDLDADFVITNDVIWVDGNEYAPIILYNGKAVSHDTFTRANFSAFDGENYYEASDVTLIGNITFGAVCEITGDFIVEVTFIQP